MEILCIQLAFSVHDLLEAVAWVPPNLSTGLHESLALSSVELFRSYHLYLLKH